MVASTYRLVQRLSILIHIERKAAFPSTAWTGIAGIYSVVFLQIIHFRRDYVHASTAADRVTAVGEVDKVDS